MDSLLLIVLIVLDLALMGIVFHTTRRKTGQEDLLAELTEERQMITDMKNEVLSELRSAQDKNRNVLEKISLMAIEAEQEVKNGGQTLANNIEGIYEEFSVKFEEPFKQLCKKQREIEYLIKRIEREKSVLARMIERGEKLCRFFNEKIPYEEVLKEIEDKKYLDARQLLVQGLAPSMVAKELGLSETEVALIANLNPAHS